MPLRKLSKLEKFRKASLKKSISYRIAAREKIKRAAKKNSDKDLVQQWRALKKLGVYDTKENPALSRLTKSRRSEIARKFRQVQGLQSYYEGEAYIPLRKHVTKKPIFTEDATGRVVQKGMRVTERYDLDTDHFQLAKGKAKQKLADSLQTKKGLLAAKSPDEKLTIDKNGNVKIIKRRDGGATIFGRLPISGPVDMLKFIDDVKAGRVRLKKNERIQLLNNGTRQKGNAYDQSSLHLLAERLERYATGGLRRLIGKKGASSFDDWASESGLVKITV